MIGIFDSGMGGLTVMRKIRDVLPSSDIVYFGDIAHAPYGSKSRGELSVLTAQAVKRLQAAGATKIVSACNSLSASLAVSIFDVFALAPGQVIEMVGPTVSYLKDTDTRIILCATPATIESQMYQQAFAMLEKEVVAIPIPDLARLIEFGGTRDEMKETIRAAFRDVPQPLHIVVLACTHYPLVADVFAEVLGSEVHIFDPAIAVAARAEKLFWPQEVGDSRTTFLISQDSDHFRDQVTEMFSDYEYTIQVVA